MKKLKRFIEKLLVEWFMSNVRLAGGNATEDFEVILEL
jgi:hypothetical protein